MSATPGYTLVSNEDASNYDRILGLLGMHEEGDPVHEVSWLLGLKESYAALEARTIWFFESREVIDFFQEAMPVPETTYLAPDVTTRWPAYSHEQMIAIVRDFVKHFGLTRGIPV